MHRQTHFPNRQTPWFYIYQSAARVTDNQHMNATANARLAWFERMVDSERRMDDTTRSDLLKWERANADGHSVSTRDWPGWEALIGTWPEVRETVRPTTLYRLWDRSGALLYVGITYEWESRRADHSTKAWWPEVFRIKLTEYPTRAAALEAEGVAIRTEDPVHNIVGRAA